MHTTPTSRQLIVAALAAAILSLFPALPALTHAAEQAAAIGSTADQDAYFSYVTARRKEIRPVTTEDGMFTVIPHVYGLHCELEVRVAGQQASRTRLLPDLALDSSYRFRNHAVAIRHLETVRSPSCGSGVRILLQLENGSTKSLTSYLRPVEMDGFSLDTE